MVILHLLAGRNRKAYTTGTTKTGNLNGMLHVLHDFGKLVYLAVSRLLDHEAGRIFFIALAGAAGTLARYWMSGGVNKACGIGFPWGTVSVNLAGCFFFGLVWTLSTDRALISPAVRTILLIGFMGGLTTFSSLAGDTMGLLREAQYLRAFANIALQNTAGLALLWLGIVTGRVL